MSPQISAFGHVLLFLLSGVLFVALVFGISRLLRPRRPNPEKALPYECGEDPVGSAWVQFNIRFYVVALIFIIFEVEVVLLFPWAVVLRDAGPIALLAGLLFLGILILGMAYEWRKGDLNWVKPEPVIPRLDLPPVPYDQVNARDRRGYRPRRLPQGTSEGRPESRPGPLERASAPESGGPESGTPKAGVRKFQFKSVRRPEQE
nr:MAG: hypothetical protein KatS3mg041_1635 [Bacteroidota bacterium]